LSSVFLFGLIVKEEGKNCATQGWVIGLADENGGLYSQAAVGLLAESRLKGS